MTDTVPMIVGPATSGQLMTKKQGYCRARGGLVDLHLPGVYTGPMLEPGRVKKIAKKGLADCDWHEKNGTLVPLKIPGHCDTRVTPADGTKLFKRLLKAAEEAMTQHDNDHVLLLTPAGTRYIS